MDCAIGASSASCRRDGGAGRRLALNRPGAGAEAAGDETWRQFRRQVLFSDVLLAPAAEFPSPARRGSRACGACERTEIDGPSGFWRIHCVAFLDPAAPSGALTLRATDVTDPERTARGGVFEVAAEPGDQASCQVDDLVLTDAMGFERGHRYEIGQRLEDRPRRRRARGSTAGRQENETSMPKGW